MKTKRELIDEIRVLQSELEKTKKEYMSYISEQGELNDYIESNSSLCHYCQNERERTIDEFFELQKNNAKGDEQ